MAPQVRMWLFVKQFTKRGACTRNQNENHSGRVDEKNEALMEGATQTTLILKSISDDIPQRSILIGCDYGAILVYSSIIKFKIRLHTCSYWYNLCLNIIN
uniref:Uncharacterized protein n=1 Tax=Leptocylindrus danicus TaxID=163516 RepID=A0A7S2JQ49_9STRA